MIEINEFQVFMLEIECLRLAWTIKPTSEDLNNYRFSVFRSGSVNGPWKLMAEDLTGFHYRDDSVNMYSQTRKYFYFIRVTDIRNHKFADYEPRQLDFLPDAVGLELIRKKNVYLKTQTGLPVLLYVRKTFGQRCPNCWDEIKQRCSKSHCEVCYNTGFLDGYWNPVQLHINEMSPKQEPASVAGQPGSISIQVETSSFPDISAGDIIVYPQTGKRFKVVNKTKNTRLGSIISQFIGMTGINPSDIDYLIGR